jgi:hypothetical protein
VAPNARRATIPRGRNPSSLADLNFIIVITLPVE